MILKHQFPMGISQRGQNTMETTPSIPKLETPSMDTIALEDQPVIVRHVCVDYQIILILIIICMYSNAPLLPFIMGLVCYNYLSRYLFEYISPSIVWRTIKEDIDASSCTNIWYIFLLMGILITYFNVFQSWSLCENPGDGIYISTKTTPILSLI